MNQGMERVIRTQREAVRGCPSLPGWGGLWVLLALAVGLRLQAGLLVFGDYAYSVEGGEVTIRQYLGAGGEAVIPDLIDDMPVTTIHRVAFNRAAVTRVTIGRNVVSIGESAFSECMSLTHVVIPDGVADVGPRLFEHCWNLTEVTVGSGLTTLGDFMFDDCRGLRHITIPDTVNGIGNYTFQGCASLTELTIPGSVQSIGAGAFQGCASLTEVVIPDGVPLADRFLVADCSSLTRVVLPESTARIATLAFRNCTSLVRLDLPANVTHVEGYAFTGCATLSGLYCQGDAPTVGRTPFTGTPNVIVYYLPGAGGWTDALGGAPTRLWLPEVIKNDGAFGVGEGGFGFNIAWADGRVVVVEACSDLVNPEWESVGSQTVAGGTARVSDPAWAEHRRRFYRLRWP